MRIYPEQLLQHIQKKLPNCCLIFGDEALLSIEAFEQIQHQAKQHGFLERFSLAWMGVLIKTKFLANLILFHYFQKNKSLS